MDRRHATQEPTRLGRAKKLTFKTDYDVVPSPGTAGIYNFLSDSFTLAKGAKHKAAAEQWLADAKAGVARTRSGDRYKPSALRSYEQALRARILPGHEAPVGAVAADTATAG